MSDTELKNKYFSIPDDAIVEIKVNGKYYSDLKRIFTEYLIEEEDKESMGKILSNITENKVSTMKEWRLLLMQILINDIESSAIEQEKAIKTAPPTQESPQN